MGACSVSCSVTAETQKDQVSVVTPICVTAWAQQSQQQLWLQELMQFPTGRRRAAAPSGLLVGRAHRWSFASLHLRLTLE